MKKTLISFLISAVILLTVILPVCAQTYGVGLVPQGTDVPATCKSGSMFRDTDDDITYICEPADTWNQMGGSLTDAELLAIAGLTSAADTGIYFTGSGSADVFTLTSFARTVLDDTTSEGAWATLLPQRSSSSGVTPTNGQIYYVDGVNWDPAGVGIGKAYYAMYDGSDWKILFDEDGDWYANGLERPSYSHISGGDKVYNDNAGGTPYGLTASEVKNSIITNAGASVDSVYTMPTYESTMDFYVMVVAGYQMDLEPASGKTIFVDGTEYGADEHIINDSDTEGDLMHCQTVESTDGVYDLHCNSIIGYWRGTNGNDSNKFYKYINIPIERAANGTTAPAAMSTLTSTHAVKIRDFDGATQNEFVYFEWIIPPDFIGTTINMRLITWITSATAPTSDEGIVFGTSAVSIGDGELLSSTLGTAVNNMVWVGANAQYDRVSTSWSSAISPAGLAVNETILIKLYRLQSDAADDYAQDVGVSMIQIRYESKN